MTDPLGEFAAAITLDPLVDEPPREGEAGGDPCHYCQANDTDALWANTHWRALPRHWSPLPGGMLLISKAHIDTLAELPAARQAEFGLIAAAIETAIMSLGAAARVHMYRWGDGRAHFHVHVHFIPRPAGRPQFAWRNLPFLEDRLPHPSAEERSRVSTAIADQLAAANLPTRRRGGAMIGRLHHVVIDCPEPAELAEFYSELIGLPVTYRSPDWVVIAENDTSSGIAFQLAPDHQPPEWRNPVRPQQFHLDIMVDDLPAAHEQVVAIGARNLGGEHVYADPAGHPFCLIPRPDWAAPIHAACGQ